MTYTNYASQADEAWKPEMLPAYIDYLRRKNMGKIIKFFLTAILCLFLLGMVIGFIEQFGCILIVIVVIIGVLGAIGKISSNQSSQPNLEAEQKPSKPIPPPAPTPVKRTEDDKIEKLHVDIED